MYLFTPLHMIRSNGQRAKKNTKHGFWRATQKCNNILDMSGNTIGIKMPLAYYSKAQNSIPHKTSWLMSEYRLPKECISSPQCHDPSILSIPSLNIHLFFCISFNFNFHFKCFLMFKFRLQGLYFVLYTTTKGVRR